MPSTSSINLPSCTVVNYKRLATNKTWRKPTRWNKKTYLKTLLERRDRWDISCLRRWPRPSPSFSPNSSFIVGPNTRIITSRQLHVPLPPPLSVEGLLRHVCGLTFGPGAGEPPTDEDEHANCYRAKNCTRYDDRVVDHCC